MTGLELTIEYSGDVALPSADSCESCGTPLHLVNVIGLVRLFSGRPEAPEPSPPDWMEKRTTVWPGSGRIDLRPHTPERCRRVRAGDPEPWTDPDDDIEEDDEDG